MSAQDIVIPNIGDFDQVDVIEVLVQVGDEVAVDQSLITVESDKASMEIPSSHAGTVKEVLVNVGDHVTEGSVIVRLESSATEATPKSEPKAAAETSAATPVAASTTAATADVPSDAYDVVVLGSGPGGYSAAFRAADLGLRVALVERYGTLGGVCLNVGCIPSKALLHTVGVYEAAQSLKEQGIHFGDASVDLEQLRGYKDKVIGKLTTGLAGMAKARKVDVVTGVGRFTSPHQLRVESSDGATELSFKSAIIAAGSQAVHLPFLPEDERIVDSTGALELKAVPERMLLIGGGIIGLEMGTVYSGLGARLDVVEMQPGLMQGADRDLVRVWQNMNKHRFDAIMLNTKTVSAEAKEDGIWVQFEGEGAPTEPQRYDLVLQAVGRIPNGKKIGADAAGVQVDERGFIAVDNQMRTNVPHIYAIGDIVGQPMLAHKAVHEAHVAAEVIAGQKSFFDARVIPSVAYTDPEVAWVGLTEDEAKKQGIAIEKGLFPWQASGRAIANNRDEGFTKLLFDAETKRILGGGIVGVGAGDLISEIALAIEMGADQVDIASTIHPHPTLGESVGMAAAASLGACTDIPPARRK
ncbi:dihydrolipoyl dehydrogenase [Paenalcaligenes hominis]|uniref:dihydrolipoyl dehydrogenase n=1 Tax=Paenalcaligenes hominis TaxID=643674 RepID=UPI003525C24D